MDFIGILIRFFSTPGAKWVQENIQVGLVFEQ